MFWFLRHNFKIIYSQLHLYIYWTYIFKCDLHINYYFLYPLISCYIFLISINCYFYLFFFFLVYLYALSKKEQTGFWFHCKLTTMDVTNKSLESWIYTAISDLNILVLNNQSRQKKVISVKFLMWDIFTQFVKYNQKFFFKMYSNSLNCTWQKFCEMYCKKKEWIRNVCYFLRAVKHSA